MALPLTGADIHVEARQYDSSLAAAIYRARCHPDILLVGAARLAVL